MPSKVYTKEQKKEVRNQLLEVALRMYSQEGIRKVPLMDILKVVNISKPFFYTFYNSVQEFVICVLEYQWLKIPKVFEEIDAQVGLNLEDQMYMFLKTITYYDQHGYLVMTQEEEVWVRKRIDDEGYNIFMENQLKFFDGLLERWGIPKEKCSPKTLGNMILIMILFHSSSKRSLPFLYLDDLDETAKAQAYSIIAYVRSLKGEI